MSVSAGIYPTYPSAGNPQNGFQWYGFPMTPQQPFQSQAPQVYDPSYFAMPPVPEQQPIFYAIDALGNYVMLAPHQYPPPVVSSDPKGINGEYNPMRLSAAYSDGSVDSAQPHYDAYNLNTSGASRKSVGSGGKARPSPAYKTMMCNMFSTNGSCTYGPSCQYAHGPAEMRPIIPHPKYKTMLCNKFHSVYGCQYGDKCHFRHPDDPNPPQASSTKTPPPSAAKTSQRKPSHGSGKKKNGHKAAKQNTATPKASPGSATSVKAASPPPPAVVAATAETKDGKKKDSLIKFAMYHCFESYVGKNRNSKPDALKRTNSSNTIGTFTLQRYVSMKKALDYMREVKKKPQCDAAVMMKQHERECSSLKDQPQEAPAAIAKDDKINLLS